MSFYKKNNKQAEAELCQAQVKLEVMFEVELNAGVEVVVEGILKLWLQNYYSGWVLGGVWVGGRTKRK